MLAKVHIASKSLAMTGGDYRAMLKRITGQGSARDCTDGQLHDLLREFRRLGFQPEGRSFSTSRPASHPVARKARALWICLYELGAIKDPSERALETFARRQLGVDRLHWADQSQGYRLIEALKAIAQRNDWDQDIPSGTEEDMAGRILRIRLILLLYSRLTSSGHDWPFRDPGGKSDRELDIYIRELGDQLRMVRHEQV